MLLTILQQQSARFLGPGAKDKSPTSPVTQQSSGPGGNSNPYLFRSCATCPEICEHASTKHQQQHHQQHPQQQQHQQHQHHLQHHQQQPFNSNSSSSHAAAAAYSVAFRRYYQPVLPRIHFQLFLIDSLITVFHLINFCHCTAMKR